MLPVVAAPATVTRRSLGYSIAMVVTSLLLWPVAPTGPLYPIVAVILGALFLLEAARLHRRARAGMSEPALGDAVVPLVDHLPGAVVRCGGHRRAALRLRCVPRLASSPASLSRRCLSGSVGPSSTGRAPTPRRQLCCSSSASSPPSTRRHSWYWPSVMRTVFASARHGCPRRCGGRPCSPPAWSGSSVDCGSLYPSRCWAPWSSSLPAWELLVSCLAHRASLVPPTAGRYGRRGDAQVRSSASRAGSIVGVGRRRADRTGSGAARARRAGRDPR